jgi:hypothetical protein
LNDDDLIEDFFLEAFPNPQRKGCPGEATIKAFAEDRLPRDDQARLHLASCSECYAEYRHYHQDREESKQKLAGELPQTLAVRGTQRKARRSIKIGWAAAAAILVISGGISIMRLERPQPVSLIRTASNPIAANVDLFNAPTLRGIGPVDGAAPLQAVSLPAAIVHLSITLPRFSESGEYVIAVSRDRAGQQPIAKGSGNAIATNGKVGVNVTLDLRNAKAGAYFLATVRGSDNGTYYYPLKVN